jgi:hypothetical protein
MKPTRENAVGLLAAQMLKRLKPDAKPRPAAWGYGGDYTIPVEPTPSPTASLTAPGGIATPTPAMGPSLGVSTGAPTVSSGGGGSITAPFDYLGLINAANQYGSTAAQYGLGKERLAFDESAFARQLALDQQTQAANAAYQQGQLANMRAQIDATLKAARLQYQLGLKQLSLGERERLDALRLGTRSLDIQAADDEFARIMRGVSEASVRGGGVPSQGLFT